MNIRVASQDDLNILLELEQGIVKYERPYDSELNEGPINYYNLSELIKSENAQVLVVEINNEIVGSGFAEIRKAKPFMKYKKFIHLGFFYVKPRYRNMGVNKMIIKGLIKWSKSKGLRNIRLKVYNKNKNALQAYLKSGFKPTLLEMRLKL
ncbi:MAG: GNAT family N-acetyltransferase [Flavobacteriaceae bacterium]|nr:GNAT family N-acetyltransferase [Flavobacteriaceae bacterium]|tara:strand:+ start:2645 stop:3097 length:453 start_codon:yes stop_codon:yes gene_type:complete